MVDGLAAPPGGLEDDVEVLLELTLADEVVERAGPQAAFLPDEVAGTGGCVEVGLVGQIVGTRFGREQLVAHQATARRWSATRSSAEGSSSSGSSRSTVVTSSGP